MTKTKFLAFAFIFVLASALSGFSQTTSNIRRIDLNQAEVDRIIRNITANEEDFRGALSNYVFNRKALIQTIGLGGQITGSYRRDSFMSLSDDGNRFEKILFAPISTLTEITVTPQDIDDLGGINPFALLPSQIQYYNFALVGKEKIDSLDLYVFEVTPKVMPNPKKTDLRLFQGRIWVDDRDLMIVKSKGKAVPDSKDNKFPVVETWRENIDGKFWFPAYSTSDDELEFDNGLVVKLKVRVKYTEYAQGRTSVKVLEDEDVPVEDKPKPDQP